MSSKEQKDMDLCQVILFAQLLIEGLDRIKSQYPNLYKFSLKKSINDTSAGLEKFLSAYDSSYDGSEDFLLNIQKQLESLLPSLRNMNLDELATLPYLAEAYKKDQTGTEKFLEQTLNVEVK